MLDVEWHTYVHLCSLRGHVVWRDFNENHVITNRVNTTELAGNPV